MLSLFSLLGMVLCTLIVAPTANGFGFGGGCGCPCMMPQPCIPQPPPIALPSLCLPQIQLPCPPPPCGGCCGRKKRGAAIGSKMGSKTLGDDSNGSHCNNPQIRRIILKNLAIADPVASKVAIHSELKAKLGGDYIVLCTKSPTLSFAADSTTDFCIEGHQALSCAVFKV